jgi:2-deoxy-D-gluconate 3-dehydrogenase
VTGWLTATFGLAGRTALVTGARGGIGQAAAVALAAAGADLVLWGRDADGLADTARQVRELGRSATVVAADLADLAATARLADEVAAAHRVDVLVNNAGMIRRAPAADTAFDDWRDVLTVNLDAVFLLAQRFGRPMIERGHGRIVNIASVLSFQGGVQVPAYAASKHAVAGLTRALANEWTAAGVTVNAVAPGYVATANTDALRADPVREAEIRSRIPAGRWAVPDDVGAAVVFLASPGAGYLTGHVLAVDGGWSAR